MLKNYFTVAFRNLIRNKFYSSINIAGLSIGIAVSMLILFYIFDELSYDHFHKDADRIYQVYLKAKLQGKAIEGAHTCAPIATASKEEITGVDESIRINLRRDVVIRYEDNIFTEKKLLLADSNFFSFFTFNLLEGNENDILNEPNQIILTETSAKKYFGYEPGNGESPLGKMVLMGTDKTNCEIVGLVKDPPSNSHFKFDMMLSMVTWDYSENTRWVSNNLFTYLKLNEASNPNQIQEKMKLMVDKYVGPELEQFMGVTLEEWRKQGDDYGYFIQPITDIHLHSKTKGNIEPPGDIAYVYLLSMISIFIILIACINFMNLSTARSASRAKEVGIRKTVGAPKARLVTQFLLESIVISAVSTLLAVGILFLTLPFFNQITEKSIGFEFILSNFSIIAMLAVMIIVGILAGSYPAFYLTSFKPTEVLKGKLRTGAKSGLIRSSLVVFQFAISVFLIVSTMIIYKQLKMIQERNLGFDKENVLIIDNTRTLGDSKRSFKKTLQTLSSVQSVSISNAVPPHIYSNSVYFPNGKQEDGILFHQIHTDHDYLKTIDLSIYSGRFFSEDFPSDSTAVIINKKGMETLGWANHEGNRLAEPSREGGLEFYNVVGIIDDFNFSSLKNEIEPLIIFLGDFGNLMPVRLSPGNINEKIKDVEAEWNKIAPGEPFDYAFLDENFDSLFRAEQQLGKIFILFTSLAIFIACLGLFGLASFIAEQRSKEIGIRKAMGASVPSVVVLLSKEFTKLVFISIIFAVPAVIYLMDWWLENFAYKTDIGVMSFVIGGLAALVISWLTVSY
ncbi:MAG: ABC transporter permease, partial [Cyclobacteriaceae bacterium]|nr:ABC transporter permease [Cyclobacteriaceae bacterium]